MPEIRRGRFSADEVEAWIVSHPGATMPGALCSAIVYEAGMAEGYTYPHTMSFARHIDNVSTRLFDAKVGDDLDGLKSTLLDEQIMDARYYQQGSNAGVWAGKPPLMERLASASRWSEVDEVLRTIGANVTFSLLACWDVEFCSHYLSKYEPRSVFTLVLPSLDPAIDPLDLGAIPKRRDMFWYPVRRLIDFSACMGGFVKHGEWPELAPEVKDIIREAELGGIAWHDQTLTNWRDGTTRFTMDDFVDLWKALCTRLDGQTQVIPWPLFFATLIFQDLLVNVSAVTKGRSIILMDDDYMQWWHHHYDELKATGCAFGTTLWPDCFNSI